MGKRIKKAKTGGVEVDVNIDLQYRVEASSLGVCTRSKAMALKKSSSSIALSTIVEDVTTKNGSDGGYLQLRSRRLERLAAPLVKRAKKRKFSPKEKDAQKSKETEVAGENGVEKKQDKEFGREEKSKKDEKVDKADEDSFGDNELHFENKERETTPISSIVSSDITKTPTLSNRATVNVNNCRMKTQNVTPRMPNAEQLEELFAEVEKQKIEKFIERYNFDPVNEKPLKGRYEWVKIEP